MNIVLFIVLIHLLKGEGLGRVWELVIEVSFFLSKLFSIISLCISPCICVY